MNKRIGNFKFRVVYPLNKWEKADPYYEIVKFYPNPHYKKEGEYDQKEEEFYFKSKSPNCRIHQDCFKNPECCYTVATFVYNEHEPCYDLKSIGSRLIDCDSIEEVQDLFSIIKYGFDILNNQSNETD